MRKILGNKWVKFGVAALLYLLVFVIWMRNWWMLLGLPLIFDLYITKFFNRHVLRYHRRWRAESRLYKVVAEWVEAVVFAAVVASIIHIFVFQMYVIPSPSMEKSLLVGDYLYVSKVTYGPKMPNTPLSMPLVHNVMPFSQTAKSYSEAIRRPYKRLAGLKAIERDDVVVFNFPAGDTVLLENTNVTYYDVVRDYGTQYGAAEGRRRLESHYTVTSRPVDKRENYVKRCVALPGDTIRISSSQLYVNGRAQRPLPGIQQMYHVSTSAPISGGALERMGITPNNRRKDPNDPNKYYYNESTGDYVLPLAEVDIERVRGMKNVIYAERIERGGGFEIFPNNDRYGWTENDFGPLWIPARGATVDLTLENLPLYERIIDVYEENELRVEGDTIYINGEPRTSYTFKMDYYWMMGDNRQNSADSRFWGFVPEDHIVGKASFVWLSLDKDKGWLDGKVRWSKMFRKIR